MEPDYRDFLLKIAQGEMEAGTFRCPHCDYIWAAVFYPVSRSAFCPNCGKHGASPHGETPPYAAAFSSLDSGFRYVVGLLVLATFGGLTAFLGALKVLFGTAVMFLGFGSFCLIASLLLGAWAVKFYSEHIHLQAEFVDTACPLDAGSDDYAEGYSDGYDDGEDDE